jgi:hypothetical protein
MSRARHRARGGHVSGGGSTHAAGTKVVAYNAENSNVMKEARERKAGGRIQSFGEGGAAKFHAGKRQRGGAVPARKEGGSVIVRKSGGAAERKEGGAVKRKSGGRVAARAHGGGVGSDKHPLSSAAHFKVASITGHGGGHGAGPANEQTDH